MLLVFLKLDAISSYTEWGFFCPNMWHDLLSLNELIMVVAYII